MKNKSKSQILNGSFSIQYSENSVDEESKVQSDKKDNLETESIKYLNTQQVIVHKYTLPKLKQNRKFTNSDDDVELEGSPSYTNSKSAHWNDVSIEKRPLTPNGLTFRTSSGINTLEYKTALNEFLSGNYNDCEQMLSPLGMNSDR